MENPMSLNGSYLSSNSTNSNDSTEIVLETFCHQVGGRSLILTYDRNTVCKPLIPQELRFYLDLPQSLRPFTPHYKGVIKVDVQVTDDEKIQLVTKTKQSSDAADVNHNLDEKDTDSTADEDSEENDEVSNETKEKAENKAEGAVNPWTFYCHGLHQQKLKENIKKRKPIDFILMEDVVSSFRFPCIMDLKMGDKMHKDYANLEKYNRQAAKWNASTSKSLGLRIAGIQAYDGKSNKYVYQDKYYGFQVTEESIKDEFIRFLHNGKHIRKKVIAAFINQLQQLYACIEEQKDSRFYSSSLLLIYEGFEENTTDEGHVNGISTESKATSVKNTQSNGARSSDMDEALNSFDRNQEMPLVNETQLTLNGIQTDMTGLASEKVGVKMIDFARSFHGHGRTEMDPINDSLDGAPDEGYLLGLNSLIKILQDILMQS
ncbi:inositol hexakisphosphate kinase 1-like [Actinia tenebrosa]|uniref:Kinase n=1 Tax=Actinia tenebrosa TaxID=6105 RepID=A0A6P8IUX6_ACTTE|nr:inositol hexakisphosphate kinase 1-like [Actinia tenebrosa]